MYNSLSPIQAEIAFKKRGKFVVKACPGSGKTYTVAARLSRLLSNWDEKNKGIATLSFTNTAWQEIENQITCSFECKQFLKYPHFLGTLDSFINTYIFLPYGHKVMHCGRRPILVGEPHGNWFGGNHQNDYAQYFDNLSYDIEGELTAFDPKRFRFAKWNESKHYQNLKKAKNQFLKKGFANQADANYFALAILTLFPSISKSIVGRFPYLIIDEAQDTSAIQYAILDKLVENGLSEIMVVGDPDQSIFEWNSAKPELFNELFNKWEENSIILNENRRSSQLICNCTSKLSSNQTSLSVNEQLKKCSINPTLIQDSDCKNQINLFLEKCRTNNIDITPEKVAVVYRSSSFYNEIEQVAVLPFNIKVWIPTNKHTKEIMLGKLLFDRGLTKQGIQKFEKGLIKGLRDISFCPVEILKEYYAKYGYSNFRKRVFRIITKLPNIESDTVLEDWIAQANTILIKANNKLELECHQDSKSLFIYQLFSKEIGELNNKQAYYLGTIHSGKGETFDAILVLLKKACATGKQYKNLLDGYKKGILSDKEKEELRVVYVGITRPRKLLCIGIPDDGSKTAWKAFLDL